VTLSVGYYLAYLIRSLVSYGYGCPGDHISFGIKDGAADSCGLLRVQTNREQRQKKNPGAFGGEPFPRDKVNAFQVFLQCRSGSNWVSKKL
jgi:hypothetical protein